MSEIIGGIPSWPHAAKYSDHQAKSKTNRAESEPVQYFMGSEKVELSKEAKMFKDAIALIKKVGFVEYSRIVRAVKAIQRALSRAIQDFSEHSKKIQEMIDSLEDPMPESVTEALARLHDMLKDSNIPEDVVDAILRYVKKELNQSSDGEVYDNKMKLVKMKHFLNFS